MVDDLILDSNQSYDCCFLPVLKKANMSVEWGTEALGFAFKEWRWGGGFFFHLIFMLCGGVEMSFSLPVKRCTGRQLVPESRCAIGNVWVRVGGRGGRGASSPQIKRQIQAFMWTPNRSRLNTRARRTGHRQKFLISHVSYIHLELWPRIKAWRYVELHNVQSRLCAQH